MKVKIVNKSDNAIPEYATILSAGMDLKAFIEEDPITKEKSVYSFPGERVLIKTGLFIELPDGYEAQIRPRSGLAIKSGITVLNTPGTIDSDYRGEIGVILINHSKFTYEVKDGDKIAQMVISKYERIEFEEVDVLGETERGAGGFGHTGK